MPAPKKPRVVYSWRLTPLNERYAVYWTLFDEYGKQLLSQSGPHDTAKEAQQFVYEVARAMLPESVDLTKFRYKEIGPGKKPADPDTVGAFISGTHGTRNAILRQERKMGGLTQCDMHEDESR